MCTYFTRYSQMISNHSDRNYLGSLLEEVNCFFSVIFGDIGNPEYFKYGKQSSEDNYFLECYFLASTLVIVFPVVVVLSIHATHIIQQAKVNVTNIFMPMIRKMLIQLFFRVTQPIKRYACKIESW